MSDILFSIFALLAVLGGLGMVLFRHPMQGAISLAMTMISLATLYGLLSAKLLFALQLIVYAGAIMSMIIFIIMFLNIQKKDLPEENNRFFYLGGAVVLVAPFAWFLVQIVQTLPGTKTVILGNGFGDIKNVGLLLFQQWLIPFEIISFLLLVALVGAVVLAGKRRKS